MSGAFMRRSRCRRAQRLETDRRLTLRPCSRGGCRDARRVLALPEVLAAPATGAADWQSRAACRQRPAQWWWPDPGSADPDGLRARRVCARCPVIGDCRDLFLSEPELDPDGVWAGLPGARLRAAARLLPDSSPLPDRPQGAPDA